MRLSKLYPRLHHDNVELRTAYIDSQISRIVQNVRNDKKDETKKMCLVCMGAGYDTMGVKMLEQSTVNMVIEFDLPGVVDAKKRIFQRLIKR